MDRECGECKRILPSSSFPTKGGNAWYRRTCYKCRTRGILVKMVHGAKYRAKLKDIEFDLDNDFVKELNDKQNGKCAISGIEMDWETSDLRKGKAVKLWNRASIDRIDSTKGYTKDNVQLIILIVNTGKSNMAQEEFIEMCRTITSFQEHNSNLK